MIITQQSDFWTLRRQHRLLQLSVYKAIRSNSSSVNLKLYLESRLKYWRRNHTHEHSFTGVRGRTALCIWKGGQPRASPPPQCRRSDSDPVSLGRQVYGAQRPKVSSGLWPVVGKHWVSWRARFWVWGTGEPAAVTDPCHVLWYHLYQLTVKVRLSLSSRILCPSSRFHIISQNLLLRQF